MYGLASQLGENMPGWRGITGGGGVGNQGPQSQRGSSRLGEGDKTKADMSQQCSHEGVSGSSAAAQRGISPLAIATPKDLDGLKVSGPDDRRRGSDEVWRLGECALDRRGLRACKRQQTDCGGAAKLHNSAGFRVCQLRQDEMLAGGV